MANKNNNTLAFVAGRSGGHILPALTLAQQHKILHPDANIIFFSTNTDLDKNLIGRAHFLKHHVMLALDNVPKKLLGYPRFLINFARSFYTSFAQLRAQKPAQIISTGGYIALPVCLAAKLLRIPITLYELNAIPGKASKLLAPYATIISICFAQAAQHFSSLHTQQAPYPLRFTDANAVISQEQALQQLGLSSTKKTLLVLGGSQGSVFINDLVKNVLECHPELTHSIQVVHQTGTHDTTDWQAFYASKNIPAIIFAYHHTMQQFYAASDLIICRAGAGTLWEIAFFGKRAITIPLETATTDHQLDNARAIATEYPYLFTVITHKDITENPTRCYTTAAALLTKPT